jgi:hypothetical protein
VLPGVMIQELMRRGPLLVTCVRPPAQADALPDEEAMQPGRPSDAEVPLHLAKCGERCSHLAPSAIRIAGRRAAGGRRRDQGKSVTTDSSTYSRGRNQTQASRMCHADKTTALLAEDAAPTSGLDLNKRQAPRVLLSLSSRARALSRP